MKPSGPRLLFIGSFFITVQFFSRYWSVQITYFSWVGLRRLYTSKNVFISFILSNFLAYSCLYYSLMLVFFFFGISVVSVITSFSLMILFIWPLFSLMSLAKSLSIYLFREPTLTDLFYCFLNIYFIYFLSELIFFLQLTLGFVCYFSSFFRCGIRLFI